MFIKKIMASIYRGGMEADEAALALGLLIEREKISGRSNYDIRAIFGERLANRRLSDAEIASAVDELVEYITKTLEPHPRAVWALAQSHEPRIVRPLINLLNRFLTNPDRVHLAYHALVGIIPLQNDQSRAAILAAVYKAAEQGHGDVKETAADYLESLSGEELQI